MHSLNVGVIQYLLVEALAYLHGRRHGSQRPESIESYSIAVPEVTAHISLVMYA